MHRTIGRAFVFICTLILLFNLSASLTKADARAPAEAFARLPVFSQMSISPNGNHMAAKMEENDKFFLVIFDTAQTQIGVKCATELNEKLNVRWTSWVNSDRVLVSLVFTDRRGGIPTVETRLYSVNTDCQDRVDMVKQKKARSGGTIKQTVQFQDDVVDFLLNDPAHILMQFNEDDARRPRVYKVDVNTGRRKLVESGRTGFRDWWADQNGEVRIAWGYEDNQQKWLARNIGGKEWRVLRSGPAAGRDKFGVVGFSVDANIVYVLSNHETGITGLYEFDLRTDQFGKKIFLHANFDAVGVEWDAAKRKLTSVLYGEDGLVRHWLDPVAQQDWQRITQSQALKGMGADIVSTSIDAQKFIISASRVTNPGGYFIYDKAANIVASLGPNYPELSGVKLSPMIPFNYAARDGLEIPAFLTLPQGIDSAEQARNLPTVVMPHGGPAARNYVGFDYEVQMLANRGYAVLQMNFRGSDGYGADFEAAGYGEWGGKMQDDVTDGALYLINEGIADPERICIVGGSYGGYAALMGAVKTPDLFKCAASLNGISDLREEMMRERYYIDDGGLDYWTTVIGDYRADKDKLRRVSPFYRANEIKVPILLVAADDDRVVDYRQSKQMARALSSAGVPHEYVELENGGHSLTTRGSRSTYLRKLDEFLGQHLN